MKFKIAGAGIAQCRRPYFCKALGSIPSTHTRHTHKEEKKREKNLKQPDSNRKTGEMIFFFFLVELGFELRASGFQTGTLSLELHVPGEINLNDIFYLT
jgi:hypothetical protein